LHLETDLFSLSSERYHLQSNLQEEEYMSKINFILQKAMEELNTVDLVFLCQNTCILAAKIWGQAILIQD